MNEENTKKFFNRFDFFRPERGLRQSLMGFGFECGDGWFQLIWDLCIAIDKELDKEREKISVEERAKRLLKQEEEYPFEVVQVKSKFAGLRFYTSSETEKIGEFPIILVGTNYWKGLIQWIREVMLKEEKNINLKILQLGN